jgi:4-aminobutyrate aminotransferase-like enzyme
MSSDASRNQWPEIETSVPGTASLALAGRLARVESRNVTFRSPDFPIFWTRAAGSNVWDADGNRYVDLTAGFGVAAVGHAHPRVLRAVRDQATRLQHGMGDVHPPEVKVRLLEALADRVPHSDPRVVLGVTGAEAVEIALKTACLATGKPGVLAFSGSYHGLGYGALGVTDRALFRAPFESQLNPHIVWAEYPDPYRPSERLMEVARRAGESLETKGSGAQYGERLVAAALELASEVLDSEPGERVGAIIVEPIQGRGGEIVPPEGFLTRLLDLCRDRDLLLICDEIFTGFGRTGSWFGSEAEGVIPDLLCAGKAFTGGMPVSACIGSADVMEAWPESAGEAMHTTTFLGHPVACAAALAAIEVIEEEELVERARRIGEWWLQELTGLAKVHPAVGDVRGRGLMIGLDLVADPETREPDPDLAGRVLVEALRRGWILLAGGSSGNVLSLTPPLNIDNGLLSGAVDMLDDVLGSVETG